MKKINSFTVLLILTIVMVIFMLITLQRPSTNSDDYDLLYPDLFAELSNVDQVKFAAVGQESFTLDKIGSDWFVAERWNYLADFNKVKRALIDISEAQILEQKTSDPEYYSLLGVNDIAEGDATSRQVTLLSDGKVVADLIVGNQRETNSTSGPSQYHVRKAGDAESWLVQGYLQLNPVILNWVQGEIFHVARERVQQVTISQPNGDVAVIQNIGEKNKFGVPNMPAGTSFKYPQLGYDIAGTIHELQLEDMQPIADFSRGDVDVVKAEFITFDGLKINSETSFIDGQYFATFKASFDPNIVQPAPEEVQAADGLKTAGQVQAEVEAINKKVSPWAYRLAGFVGTNLMRAEADIINKSEQSIPMPADVTGGFGAN